MELRKAIYLYICGDYKFMRHHSIVILKIYFLQNIKRKHYSFLTELNTANGSHYYLYPFEKKISLSNNVLLYLTEELKNIFTMFCLFLTSFEF